MTVELHVYDGRTFIGRIVETDHERAAYDGAGRVIGTFASRKAAIAAIVAEWEDRDDGRAS